MKEDGAPKTDGKAYRSLVDSLLYLTVHVQTLCLLSTTSLSSCMVKSNPFCGNQKSSKISERGHRIWYAFCEI
jgi:hypothetical protein